MDTQTFLSLLHCFSEGSAGQKRIPLHSLYWLASLPCLTPSPLITCCIHLLGCHNKLQQTQWLKMTEVHLLHLLETPRVHG